jgi:hypothetical protein
LLFPARQPAGPSPKLFADEFSSWALELPCFFVSFAQEPISSHRFRLARPALVRGLSGNKLGLAGSRAVAPNRLEVANPPQRMAQGENLSEKKDKMIVMRNLLA